MLEYGKEIRDPIHVFIKIDPVEKQILDCPIVQRLRQIHQLALTYLVYPGATHRRFEHSLGVMELAGRIYDIVTDLKNIHDDSIRAFLPSHKELEHQYWRKVLRIAALCHDIGHLPFSHAAETLFPKGWDHERITCKFILESELASLLDKLKIKAEDVAKLAVGPEKYKGVAFSNWETILAEIIVGNVFGADRIDYLLRDSYHTGVAYGKFDHYRLLEKLHILPVDEEGSKEPALGIGVGGLNVAESLLLARYFMFTQVYYHKVRRIYDIHLKEFLQAWLPNHVFPTNFEEYLYLTDNEINSALAEAFRDKGINGHEYARRILGRQHFKLLYEGNPGDYRITPEASELIYHELCNRYGEQSLRKDLYKKENMAPIFPVLMRDGRIESSVQCSELLNNIPVPVVDYIYIEPDLFPDAFSWLSRERDRIIEEGSTCQGHRVTQ